MFGGWSIWSILWWILVTAAAVALATFVPRFVSHSDSGAGGGHQAGSSTGSGHKQDKGNSSSSKGADGGAGGGGWEDEWGGGGEEEEEHDSSFGETVRLKAQAPAGASGEIARILSARDHYAVLDVARDAPAADVKKAYRLKQMATHPDKNAGAVGALEASQRVNAANDVLSDEVRRQQYYVRLLDEEENGPRSARRGRGGVSASFAEQVKLFDEFVRVSMPPPPEGGLYPTIDPSAYDPWGEAPDHCFRMACSCGYDHLARKVAGRTGSHARKCHCQQCGSFVGRLLPARDNDVWFETNNNILAQINPERYIKAYRCVGLFVYDVTAWASCNGMLKDAQGNPAPVHTHYVPFRLQGAPSSKHAKAQQDKRGKAADANYGFGQFKGKGNDSHKMGNRKKKGRR